MVLNLILGFLALLSLALLLWQWGAARRFPLHQRLVTPIEAQPPVTLLKPLKGCDPTTQDCLRSWLTQEYAGGVQVLFGVGSPDDPVCDGVRRIIAEHPGSDAQLIVCNPNLGANAKVSKLVELERLAKHELVVISDADVRAPADLLSNLALLLAQNSKLETRNSKLETQPCGLATCFYRLRHSITMAMKWEALAVNADFWSQVLQSQSLKPLDFALGAVMATRRSILREIGGFAALADCLADDYQLGNRIARRGYRIALCPVVVECNSAPLGWAEVWKHQLRWARTIRVCQPAPYFFSILSNATLWPLMWLAARPSWFTLWVALGCWFVRMFASRDLQRKLAQGFRVQCSGAAPAADNSKLETPNSKLSVPVWFALLKDLLQVPLWLLAFAGNTIEWRGQRLRLRRDGTLERVGS